MATDTAFAQRVHALKVAGVYQRISCATTWEQIQLAIQRMTEALEKLLPKEITTAQAVTSEC